jgi:hypothetical protein
MAGSIAVQAPAGLSDEALGRTNPPAEEIAPQVRKCKYSPGSTAVLSHRKEDSVHGDRDLLLSGCSVGREI